MAPRLSEGVVRQIRNALIESRLKMKKPEMLMLAQNYNTTYETIRYHQACLRKAQAGVSPRRMGRRRIVTPEMDNAVHYILEKCPHLYQDEIAEFLFDVFSIGVCQKTVCNQLKRIKITRKKLRVEAAQRNQVLRDA